MAERPVELDQDNELHGDWVADERQPQGLQFTPKVAPSFDGGNSWIAFDEAIDDWLNITTLTPEKWAPCFKARLVGDASIYKPLLDRERDWMTPMTASITSNMN